MAGSKASLMSPDDRKQFAVRALDNGNVSALAAETGVSRKFGHEVKNTANRALDDAFRQKNGYGKAVRTVDVTQEFIIMAVVLLCMVGKCPFSAVIQIVKLLFGYHLCKGTIHNILCEAIARAKSQNSLEDLSNVEHITVDEIFQAGRPVLAGVEQRSGYSFMLTEAENRNAETWSLELEICKEQSLAPLTANADGGLGLRKAMREVFPQVPCDSDVFHALKDITEVLGYVERKACGALSAVEETQKKMEKNRHKGKKASQFSRKLGSQSHRAEILMHTHDTLETIYKFLRDDVLQFNELPFKARHELFFWLMGEIKAIEENYKKLPALRKKLENQAETLLAPFQRLDQEVIDLAAETDIPIESLRGMIAPLKKQQDSIEYEMAYAEKANELGEEKADRVVERMLGILGHAYRTSSAIENFNSKLRTYFNYRREIGHGFLELFRFYHNHSAILRSRKEERVGKSPAEILTGKPHEYWLAMLGYVIPFAA